MNPDSFPFQPPPAVPLLRCPRFQGSAESLGTSASVRAWYLCRSCGHLWSVAVERAAPRSGEPSRSDS